MQKLLFLFILVIVSVHSFAQSANENWFTNFEKANQYATENNTNILMVFSGSDWCKPCIQFKADILKSDSFQDFAAESLAILYLDFPARKKNRLSKEQTAHNESLAEKYNRGGAFPKIVLLDPQENILSQPEFKGQSPESFIDELKTSIQ